MSYYGSRLFRLRRHKRNLVAVLKTEQPHTCVVHIPVCVREVWRDQLDEIRREIRQQTHENLL